MAGTARNSEGPRPVLMAIRIILLATAVFALSRQLRSVNLEAVVGSMRSYGALHLIVAAGFVVASFLVLGGIEILGVRYAGQPARSRITVGNALRTSFVASAFSQAIGFAVLTGTAVRARRYGHAGVSAADTGRVSGFVTVTSTLGLLAGAGGTLLFTHAPLHVLGMAMPARLSGILLLSPVASYVIWSIRGAPTVRIRSFEMKRPDPGTAAMQIVIALFDLLMTALVLYVFINATTHVAMPLFMRSYFVAQALAVISHVPGGLGVFEAGLLALLTAGGLDGQAAAVAAALVLFRVSYYFIPLVVAVPLS